MIRVAFSPLSSTGQMHSWFISKANIYKVLHVDIFQCYALCILPFLIFSQSLYSCLKVYMLFYVNKHHFIPSLLQFLQFSPLMLSFPSFLPLLRGK